jgi:transposase
MSLLGIDLHSNRITVARLAVKNEAFETIMGTYTFERDSFQRFLDSLSENDYVLVENTFNAFWFHDQIADRVKKCLVYNTNEARREGNKSDKIDARKLVKKLGYYLMMGERREDLPTVYVVAAKIREIRGLFTTYQLYKKMKVQLKNRIHSILKQNGICIERGKIDRKDFEARIDGFEISETWRFQIRSALKTLRSVHEEQKEIKDQIYFLGYKLFKEEIELLMSIRGFSAFTAIALMSDVVDVNRFSGARKFCSYLRATPKVKSSNRSIQTGHVNRQSRPLTCSLLTQSILQLSEAGEHMNEFYGRVKVGKSAGKSRIALIRKILVSAYHMLNRKQTYHWVEVELYSKKLEELQKKIRKLELFAEEEKKPA